VVVRKFEKCHAARPVPLPAVFTDSAAFPAAGEQMALSRALDRKATRAMLGDDTAGRLQQSSMTRRLLDPCTLLWSPAEEALE